MKKENQEYVGFLISVISLLASILASNLNATSYSKYASFYFFIFFFPFIAGLTIHFLVFCNIKIKAKINPVIITLLMIISLFLFIIYSFVYFIDSKKLYASLSMVGYITFISCMVLNFIQNNE